MSWANQPGPDGRSKGWWAKTVVAGLIGGAAMMLFLMASYSAAGLGAWFPANGIATVIPTFRPVPGELPAPDFVAAQSLTGLLIHAILSGALGVIFGGIVEGFLAPHARNWPWMAMAGFVFATFVWMFFGFGGVYLAGLQPVFGTATFFFGHLVYGVVLGLSLATLTSRRDLMTVTFAPEEKPAVEPLQRR
jgi:hypothetical protein